MQDLILWAGFAGAWLLVIGPVYQAVMELNEEDAEMERVRTALRDLPHPEPVSHWWLLIPPVWYVARVRQRREFQRLVRSNLADEHYDTLLSYVSTATGWIYVSLGGCLIAVKETWGLIEEYEWPHPLFWVIVGVMMCVAIGHTLARIRHYDRVRATRAAGSAD